MCVRSHIIPPLPDQFMLAQSHYTPLSFSKSDSNTSNSVLIDQFLKEALQILSHVDTSLHHNGDHIIDQVERSPENDENEKNSSVTWQLRLTPTTMTLDTSILTVSGLEEVLELIRINVRPRPPKVKDKRSKRIHSDQYDMHLFHRLMHPLFQLSMIVAVPRLDQSLAQQYNSVQFMRQCVHCFINCGYSFFLDAPSLLANTDMILSVPSAANEHPVESLLVLSICSLIVRHTSLHHRVDPTAANILMHSYYAQARLLLEDLFDVHHISVVISMFILSVYAQGRICLFAPSTVQTPLLKTAIRMALTMDLHKLDVRHDKESDQKERLRRLAWMLLCADYYADWNTTGQTGLIDVSDWHVDFPQPLPNEQSPRRTEYFSQYCRIVMLRKMELFRTAYMLALQSPQEALFSGLDEQLFQTYFNTPNAFNINLNPQTFLTQAWTRRDIESLLLNELYCHTQLSARLPFLPKRLFEVFIADEESTRLADLNSIHQRIRQISIVEPTHTLYTTTGLLHHRYHAVSPTESRPELELYCLIGCLQTVNTYTLILETLASLDTMGCHHNPLFGIAYICHLCLIFQKSYPDDMDIVSFCQIHLVRMQRLLRQVRSVYADPAILFLDTMLARRNIVFKQDVSLPALLNRAYQLIGFLQARISHSNSNNTVKA